MHPDIEVSLIVTYNDKRAVNAHKLLPLPCIIIDSEGAIIHEPILKNVVDNTHPIRNGSILIKTNHGVGKDHGTSDDSKKPGGESNGHGTPLPNNILNILLGKGINLNSDHGPGTRSDTDPRALKDGPSVDDKFVIPNPSGDDDSRAHTGEDLIGVDVESVSDSGGDYKEVSGLTNPNITKVIVDNAPVDHLILLLILLLIIAIAFSDEPRAGIDLIHNDPRPYTR